MKKLIFCFATITSLLLAEEPFYYFKAPHDWKIAKDVSLSPKVKVGYTENEKKSFIASINLATEKTEASIDEYLERVSKIHGSNPATSWKSLGSIQTKSGKAYLTQIDNKSPIGDIRILQSIMIDHGYAYILTGVCLKKDIGIHHQTFIDAFSSFFVHADYLESIHEKPKQASLQKQILQIKTSALQVSDKLNLDSSLMQSFNSFLRKEFSEKGSYWQTQVAHQVLKEIQKHIDEKEPV